MAFSLFLTTTKVVDVGNGISGSVMAPRIGPPGTWSRMGMSEGKTGGSWRRATGGFMGPPGLAMTPPSPPPSDGVGVGSASEHVGQPPQSGSTPVERVTVHRSEAVRVATGGGEAVGSPGAHARVGPTKHCGHRTGTAGVAVIWTVVVGVAQYSSRICGRAVVLGGFCQL